MHAARDRQQQGALASTYGASRCCICTTGRLSLSILAVIGYDTGVLGRCKPSSSIIYMHNSSSSGLCATTTVAANTPPSDEPSGPMPTAGCLTLSKTLDTSCASLPLCLSQLFTTSLWLLDSYWKYPLFSLFMIATFEATVVMQRIKNLQTLKGMGNDVVKLKVFRAGRWERGDCARTRRLIGRFSGVYACFPILTRVFRGKKMRVGPRRVIAWLCRLKYA